MRRFTRADINFIIENEAKMTLGELAKFFDCNWKEVYKVYDDETKKLVYKKRYDIKRDELKRRTELNKIKRMNEEAVLKNEERRESFEQA